MAPIPSSVPRSFQYWNAVGAGNTQEFNLDAGVYGLLLGAGGFTGAALQKLLPDGLTWVTVSIAAVLPNTYTVLQLMAGRYRLVVTGTTLIGEIALIARGGFR